MDTSIQNGRDIGECIYCGTREAPLKKEHAVPYGLNGPWTLLRASCERCEKITHRFERDTMRSLWPDVRNALAMQSRRRDKRSPTFPLIIVRNGVKEEIQVSRAEFPTYLHMPLFPPPSVYWSGKPIEGVFTNLTMIHVAGPTLREASQRYPGATFIGGHSNFSPVDFARTLAKISFCVAISAFGTKAFTHTPIKNVILGTDACIGRWVGSWYGEPVTETYSGLHAIKIQFNLPDSTIHVFLRLFAQFGAPEYQIVLGKADPDFVASDEWPAMWKAQP